MIILVGDPSPLFSLLFILSSIGDWCDAYLLYLFPNKPNKGEIFTNIGTCPPYSLFLFNPSKKEIGSPSFCPFCSHGFSYLLSLQNLFSKLKLLSNNVLLMYLAYFIVDKFY